MLSWLLSADGFLDWRLATDNRRPATDNFTLDDLELSAAELPEAMRAWLQAQPAVLIAVERLGADRVLLRRLLDVDPQLVVRARVTLAKYREALMNLT